MIDALPGLVLLILGLLALAKDLGADPPADVPDDWDAVEGRVVSAEAVSVGEARAPGGGGWPVWRARIAYRYVVGGVGHDGVADRFARVADGDLDAVEAVVAAFPKETRVVVRVDPRDPTRSVLETRPRSRALFGLGLALLAAGALLLVRA